MRPSARRSDDADLIRARLRSVLAELDRAPGWVPPDDLLAGPQDESDDGTGDDAGDETVDDPVGPGADPDEALPAGLGRHRAPGVATRLDPGRPGARALWITGVLAAVLVVGWTWLDRPQVETVAVESAGPAASAPPAPATAVATESAVVVVSVVGRVARPGLVTLPAGSRVADALTAAGGLLPDADPATVNAAAPLTDGQQIAVGVPGAPSPPGSGGGGSGTAGPLDLNAATVADLDALPGIGPVLAQRIVDHRSQHGRFASVEQLDDVPGIGPAIYAALADLVRV